MRPARHLAPLVALALAAGAARADWINDGVRLCGSAGIQRNPVGAFDGHGAIVTWEDQRAGVANPDIFAARVLPSGALAAEWPLDGAAVCTAAGAQQNPRVVPDGTGGVFVTWDDARNGSTNFDVYVQRLAPDGQAAPGWPANGIALGFATGNQYGALPCPDGLGGVYVAWVDERAGQANADIYLVRVLANGSVAAGWTAGGTVVCDTTGLQTPLDLTSDGQNGAVVTWVDRRSDTEYDLYARRFTPAGTPAAGWLRQGSPVTRGAGDQLAPVAVADDAGGVYVVWSDFRSGAGDIYAQHLGPAGAPTTGWAADGNLLGPTAGWQDTPRAAADGQGGLLAVWLDYQVASDVVGTRVNADGSRPTGWAADGNMVCGDASLQFAPVVIGDGAGGAYFAWEDQRNVGANSDIWGVHFGPAGAPFTGWPTNGSSICTAGGLQSEPTIAVDGAGGAYLTWQDRRNLAHFDVYAARLGPAGDPVAGAPSNPTDGAILALAGSNPFRGSARVTLALAAAGPVRVDVLDTAGRRVRTLARGARPAGAHTFSWDGRDETGRDVAAGVYFVRARGSSIDARLKLVRAR